MHGLKLLRLIELVTNSLDKDVYTFLDNCLSDIAK
jgi:hypothetical protein